MLTKDTAICIRATDYSETSQIVTFFTRANGKIGAIAKGSKRSKSKFDGPIEVFSHGEIVFSDSNKEKLATLTEFQQQPGYTHLGKNLFVLHCCLFAVELLSNLTNDFDPHPELFDSFQQYLKNIDEKPAASSCDESRRGKQEMKDKGRKALSFLILFQLVLLREVGLIPVFDYCVNCKTRGTKDKTNWSEVYFSSTANGFICKNCEASFPDKIRLTKTAADCLSNLKKVDNSEEKTLNEIEKVLIHHFTEILHHQPKMAKHILKN